MQIPVSILGESPGAQARLARADDASVGESAHGERFAKLLDPEPRDHPEHGAEEDAEPGAEGAEPERAGEHVKDGESAEFAGALRDRAVDAFEQIVADMRVKSAREKLLLAPKKSMRVHENLSSTHVARLALLAGQSGAHATRNTARPSLASNARDAKQEHSSAQKTRGLERDARVYATDREERALHTQNTQEMEREGAASESPEVSASPQNEAPVFERSASSREALDAIVSKLHRTDRLPARDPGSTPIVARQMLPAHQMRATTRLADLAQARDQLVRMKATQTGGVLELDIGVEHAREATLRLEIEDGKARAICRCRAPEAVVEAHKMVDSLREVLARAGMELGEVDVRFEGDERHRDGSRHGAPRREGDATDSTRGSRGRISADDEELDVIVSGLVHVIG